MLLQVDHRSTRTEQLMRATRIRPAEAAPTRLPHARTLPVLIIGLLLALLAASSLPLERAATLDPAAIQPYGGAAYAWAIPEQGALLDAGPDRNDAPMASGLRLMEAGRPLGPAHSGHPAIMEQGGGRYSHWQNAVIFSASDGSDPRANGRRYTVEYALWPAMPALATAAAGLALAGLLVLAQAWRRRRERLIRLTGRSYDSALLLAAIACLAGLLTYLQPLRLTTTLDGAAAKADARYPGVHFFWTDNRGYGPFLEVVEPAAAAGRLALALDGQPLQALAGELPPPTPGDIRPAAALERLARQPGSFLDEGGRISFSLPAEGGPLHLAALAVTYPVRVSPAGCALAGLLALLLAGLRPLARAWARQPDWPRAWLLLTTPLAAAGAALLLVNLLAALQPLRSPALGATPGLYGPDDLRLDLAAAQRRLARVPGEPAAAFAARATHAVSQAVLHRWDLEAAPRLNFRVPITENWLLWLRAELDPRYRLYHFIDHAKGLERGAGMCSQAALILVGYLRAAGLDARVVQLTGHTLVTAEVEPGIWHMLDPDVGVVMPLSLAALEAEPALARPYYLDSYLASGLDPRTAEANVAFYTPLFERAGNAVEPAGGNVMMGEAWVQTERLAYALKWPLPAGAVLLVLPGLAGQLWQRRRLAARPA
jgi:hypothetical protein